MTFSFHFDAGHGWLAVKLAQVAEIGLSEADFTAYSYRDRDTLYLEEDCDASTFIAAWKAERGSFDAHEIDDGDWSPIRHLDRVRTGLTLHDLTF